MLPNSLLVLMAVCMLVTARPESKLELPNHQKAMTDPTRSRRSAEGPPESHVVKKSGVLGTRIGRREGPDPNTYWEV